MVLCAQWANTAIPFSLGLTTPWWRFGDLSNGQDNTDKPFLSSVILGSCAYMTLFSQHRCFDLYRVDVIAVDCTTPRNRLIHAMHSAFRGQWLFEILTGRLEYRTGRTATCFEHDTHCKDKVNGVCNPSDARRPFTADCRLRLRRLHGVYLVQIPHNATSCPRQTRPSAGRPLQVRWLLSSVLVSSTFSLARVPVTWCSDGDK